MPYLAKAALSVAALALDPGSSTGTAAQRSEAAVEAHPLSVALDVKVSGPSIVVSASFANRSDRPALVKDGTWGIGWAGMPDKPLRLWGPEFVITTDGKSMAYWGNSLKTIPLQREHFTIFQPGATSSRSLEIADSYEFLAGTHAYSIEMIYVEYDEAKGAVVTFRSAPGMFTYTR